MAQSVVSFGINSGFLLSTPLSPNLCLFETLFLQFPLDAYE